MECVPFGPKEAPVSHTYRYAMCCRNLPSRSRDLLIAVINNALVFGFINVILLLYCVAFINQDSVALILTFVLGLFLPMLIVGLFFGLLSIGPCRNTFFLWVSIFFYAFGLILIVVFGYLLAAYSASECWGYWMSTTLGFFSLLYLIVRSYMLQKHLGDKGSEQFIIEGDVQFADTPKLREFKTALYILLIAQFIVCTVTGAIFFGASKATNILTTADLAYPFGLSGAFYVYMTVMGVFLLNSPFAQYYKSLMVFETISTVFVVGLTAWLLVLNAYVLFFLIIVVGFWAAIMGTAASVIKRKMLATTVRHVQLQDEDVGDVELEGEQRQQQQQQQQHEQTEKSESDSQTRGHY